MSTTNRTWITQGAEVAIDGGGMFTSITFARIERLTPTQIVLDNGRKFRRAAGHREIGTTAAGRAQLLDPASAHVVNHEARNQRITSGSAATVGGMDATAMTRQLAAPISHLSLTPTNRMAEDIVHQVRRGSIVLDPPYQRASVWTYGQSLDLMYSLLSGYPIGTAIFNDRMRGAWLRDGDFKVSYAVIDGRQRIETLCAWFTDRLAIPASWLAPEWITPGATVTKPGDGPGPYVYLGGLTEAGARYVESRMAIPVVTAQVDTVEAEAEIYRLVNAGGTAQTADDLARAARVARGQ